MICLVGLVPRPWVGPAITPLLARRRWHFSDLIFLTPDWDLFDQRSDKGGIKSRSVACLIFPLLNWQLSSRFFFADFCSCLELVISLAVSFSERLD